jgi:hypothetical protein
VGVDGLIGYPVLPVITGRRVESPDAARSGGRVPDRPVGTDVDTMGTGVQIEGRVLRHAAGGRIDRPETALPGVHVPDPAIPSERRVMDGGFAVARDEIVDPDIIRQLKSPLHGSCSRLAEGWRRGAT